MEETSQSSSPDGDFSRGELSEVLKRLNVSAADGLSTNEAANRLAEYGPNELQKSAEVSVFKILLDQFKSAVVLLLLAASVVSVFMHQALQAIGIAAALLINAAIGFFTEYRANLSLQSLAKLSGGHSRVRREGSELDLPVSQLVPGDVVLLESGNRVPADLRLIESASLAIDESTMTGETVPAYKSVMASDAEEANCTIAFGGTLVAAGRGTGVVIATGKNSKIGQLGDLLSSAKGATPMEQKLEVLGQRLAKLAIVLCIVIAVVGILHQEPVVKMIETSIVLAISAIPEGLPVMATLALAIGIRRLVKEKALVRNLVAVETLGCTTVICADKTGTLTENQMVVTDVVMAGGHAKITGSGYVPEGKITDLGTHTVITDNVLIDSILLAGAVCNDAKLEQHTGDYTWHIHGDPTEGALLVAAQKAGIDSVALRAGYKRIGEFPFDLRRKRMSTIHKGDGNTSLVFCKGAPTSVFEICSYVKSAAGIEACSQDWSQYFVLANERLAAQGLRVLAVATKEISEPIASQLNLEDVESGLTLLGLVGMMDPPKQGVREFIDKCHRAGIRIIMLTGDQPATAAAIAEDLHICSKGDHVCPLVTGLVLEQQVDNKILKQVEQCNVMARIAPNMKLRIVQLLQQAGEVVAMTGDGVNDAPALHQSDIGVAIGAKSSDLAREAADIFITDGKFGTIGAAILQGRITFQNIQRVVGYLLTASLATVFTIVLGVLTDSGLMLLPLQILWLNLIVHTFPSLGIILSGSNAGLMEQSPRGRSGGVIDTQLLNQIFIRSAVISVCTLGALWWSNYYLGEMVGSSVVLATLTISILVQAFSWSTMSFVKSNEKRNSMPVWPLYLTCIIGLLLLVVAFYVPVVSEILGTVYLSKNGRSLSCAVATVSYVVIGIICSSLKNSRWLIRGGEKIWN